MSESLNFSLKFFGWKADMWLPPIWGTGQAWVGSQAGGFSPPLRGKTLVAATLLFEKIV
mgnify:CR=1 FL=1